MTMLEFFKTISMFVLICILIAQYVWVGVKLANEEFDDKWDFLIHLIPYVWLVLVVMPIYRLFWPEDQIK